MAVLNDFPNEVLDAICTDLRSTKSSLYSLCLAAKRYHVIALPHLYYHIEPADINGQFAWAILRNQKLGKLVHSLKLEELNGSQDEKDEAARETFLREASNLSLSVKVDAIEAKDEIDSEQEDESDEDNDEAADVSSDDDDDADAGGDEDEDEQDIFTHRLVQTMFTTFTNLEKLDMVVPYGLNLSCLRDRRVNPGGKILLPLLKSISLRHWDTEGGFMLDGVLHLLSVSNTVVLNAFACAGLYDTTKTWSFPTVREIKLENSALSRDDFDVLVQACPNLETFSYTSADANVAQDKDDAASPYQVLQALEPLATTLRHLTIDYTASIDEDMEFDEDEDDESTDELLKSFTNLKTCRVV